MSNDRHELRNDLMIYRDGQPLLSLHRCLDHTATRNPAGASLEDIQLIAQRIVNMLNWEGSS